MTQTGGERNREGLLNKAGEGAEGWLQICVKETNGDEAWILTCGAVANLNSAPSAPISKSRPHKQKDTQRYYYLNLAFFKSRDGALTTACTYF